MPNVTLPIAMLAMTMDLMIAKMTMFGENEYQVTVVLLQGPRAVLPNAKPHSDCHDCRHFADEPHFTTETSESDAGNWEFAKKKPSLHFILTMDLKSHVLKGDWVSAPTVAYTHI